MAKWRVWNKHSHGLTHKEKFRDEMIEIKAGEYILMDYEEAVRFRGQYFPMKKNAQGADDPAGFKMIYLEPHDADGGKDAPAPPEFICNFDGVKFPTQAMLDKHIKDNYAEHIFKDEALEEVIKKEQAEKRGPGRPPKEKAA